MSRFFAPSPGLRRLTDNSYKAIDEGAYEVKVPASHDPLDMRRSIISCPHAALITEIKYSSPSLGKIRDKTSVAEIAQGMADSGSTAISVLTQPYLFDGSIEYLASVRKRVACPVMMKDIVVSRAQVDAGKSAGADCVLLIMSVFDQNLAEESLDSLMDYCAKRGLQVLVEAHTDAEYGEAVKSGHALVGINNRDLATLKIDIANTERLIDRHGKGKSTIVAESGIRSASDIQFLRKAGADAFLVGTSIMENADITSKVKELYFAV